MSEREDVNGDESSGHESQAVCLKRARRDTGDGDGDGGGGSGWFVGKRVLVSMIQVWNSSRRQSQAQCMHIHMHLQTRM